MKLKDVRDHHSRCGRGPLTVIIQPGTERSS